METAILLISLAIIPVLIAIILFCLKIKTSKDNDGIHGVAGTVTKKNPEDVYAPANPNNTQLSLPEDDSCVRTPSYDRKLPEIPSDVNEIYKNSTKEDSNSELYATVDENPSGSGPAIGAIAASGSGPHFHVSNHPYAKVKKKPRLEHPYAKVGETSKNCNNGEDDAESETEEYETAENLLGEQSATENLQSGSRNSSGRSGGGAAVKSWAAPPQRRPEDIPHSHSRQATPLPPEPPHDATQAQPTVQHFSGDSQDSMSKGYTSISVREPLSMIRPIAVPEHPPLMEGTYAPWSETSDDMYAAIDDTVYNNPAGPQRQGPEMPLPVNDVVDNPGDVDNMYTKVDKDKKKNDRQMKGGAYDVKYAKVNKRNERSSAPEPTAQNSLVLDQSGGSGEMSNLGARPKQRSPQNQFRNSSVFERNPSGSGGGPFDRRSKAETIDYSAFEVSLVDSERAISHEKLLHSLTPDFHTTRTRVADHRREQSLDASWSHNPTHTRDDFMNNATHSREDFRNSQTHTREEYMGHREPGYETVPYAHSAFSANSDRDMGYEVLPNREPGYEVVPQRKGTKDPGYETVPSRNPPSDPGYETVPSELIDPGYETVPVNRNRGNSVDPGYETVPPKSELNDPGYESVKRPSDPGYETVPHQRVNGRNSGGYRSPQPPQHTANYNYLPQNYPTNTAGYESVKHDSPQQFRNSRDPGYESVVEPNQDPGYESIQRPRKSSVEPGYETVSERGTPRSQPETSEPDLEVRYSKVKKKGKAKAPDPLATSHLLTGSYHSSEPELSNRQSNLPDVDINYEALPEKERMSGNNTESEEGYETIPVSKRSTVRPEESQLRVAWDPEYETVSGSHPVDKQSDPGYETIPTRDTEVISDFESTTTTDPDYARLKQLDDKSDDECSIDIPHGEEHEEDTTVESSQGSSLIHMSVVDSGGENGMRRSSVVMIEHVDMTPVPSADLDTNMDPNIHIFV